VDSCVPARSSGRYAEAASSSSAWRMKARRIHGPEEVEGTPELVISLGPPPGPSELLGGAKPRMGSRPGRAHRVQRLGCRHEFLVSQLSGGSGPLCPGRERPCR